MPATRLGLTLDLNPRDDEARAEGWSSWLAASNPIHTMVKVGGEEGLQAVPGHLPWHPASRLIPVVNKATGLCLACVSASAQLSQAWAWPLGLLNLIAQWVSCYCPH